MRRVVYAMSGLVLLAAPAMAAEYSEQDARSPNWICDKPVSQLSMAQIDLCRTKIDAAREVFRLVCPGGKCDEPVVMRGSK